MSNKPRYLTNPVFGNQCFFFICTFHSRIALDDAQKSLSRTNEELQFTKRELYVAQTQLTHSDRMLLETELRLSLLSQSRFELLTLKVCCHSTFNIFQQFSALQCILKSLPCFVVSKVSSLKIHCNF